MLTNLPMSWYRHNHSVSSLWKFYCTTSFSKGCHSDSLGDWWFLCSTCSKVLPVKNPRPIWLLCLHNSSSALLLRVSTRVLVSATCAGFIMDSCLLISGLRSPAHFRIPDRQQQFTFLLTLWWNILCPGTKLVQCCQFYLSSAGSAEEFNYTRMGGNTVIEGIDDRADMVETRKTFTLLGK